MPNIAIDQEKCTKCEKCLNVCPNGVFDLGIKAAVISHSYRCISCGHCAAICPTGAITCRTTDNKNPFRVETPSPDLTPELRMFRTKRSIRNFKFQPIAKNKIEALVEYAEKAPSAHNSRDRKYLVLSDIGEIERVSWEVADHYRRLLWILKPFIIKTIALFDKKTAQELENLMYSFRNLVSETLKGRNPIFRTAQCVVCIAAPRHAAMSHDDCVAAQHYMMLYGHTLGIGSFIVGFAQHAHRSIEKYLGLSGRYKIFAVSGFGYPRYTYEKEIQFEKPEILWV